MTQVEEKRQSRRLYKPEEDDNSARLDLLGDASFKQANDAFDEHDKLK